MAETIISPGVFTRENDLSFLPKGIGAIGAAIVGPTQKGPAFIPTLIRNGFSEFVRKFGDQHPETYVPFTVKEYLRNAGVVTVVRVLAGGGYAYTASRGVAYIVDEENDEIQSVIIPSKQANGPVASTQMTTMINEASSSVAIDLADRVQLSIQGTNIATTNIITSFSSASTFSIDKVLGNSPYNSKNGANNYDTGGVGDKPAHLWVHFKSPNSGTATQTATTTLSIQNTQASDGIGGHTPVGAATPSIFTSSFTEGYDHAKTPFITSGFLNLSGTTANLFKFHTIADGDSTNTDYKISIAGLRHVPDVEGKEQYATFTVQIRKYGDTDKTPSILESFNNCNLDPDSPNFISRRIGDRYQVYSDDFGKVITKGDYPNISQFVYVEVSQQVSDGSLSPNLGPRGFRSVSNTISDCVDNNDTKFTMPAFTTSSKLEIGGTYNPKTYLGWDFTHIDNKNWNKAVPLTEVGGAGTTNKQNDFNVDRLYMHASSSIAWKGSLSASVDLGGTTGPTAMAVKFSVPFQGGLDGVDPATIIQTGEYLTATNAFGMNLSTTSAVGYKGYKKALDILSNQDEYDINMLALPGVIKELHASVTDAATVMCEDRADTFYVMDLATETATVASATNQANGLDSNYAAVYYPWVKVLDTSRNKPVFVPPSVIVPGAIAASDRIGAEWFAPAGLNRGVLGTVLEAKHRLNQAERDSLYESRVNPIATFPATGVCIWGQKTLQVRPTALDRINVRRLLITLKKFIASSSKYLVFEQNTIQTRNRFLNIVNPYLESVQQRQGLYAFRVVMDESNNTPTEIDRNRLVGGIYLQPAKTAEFIVLDFNILPTGATFPS